MIRDFEKERCEDINDCMSEREGRRTNSYPNDGIVHDGVIWVRVVRVATINRIHDQEQAAPIPRAKRRARGRHVNDRYHSHANTDYSHVDILAAAHGPRAAQKFFM